jgi:hypothetical protein
MHLRLKFAISMTVLFPILAHAQEEPSTVKMKEDAQKVVKIISGDKAKTRPIAIVLNSAIKSKRLNPTVRNPMS